MDRRNHPGSSLQKHAERLRDRTEAVCRFSGGHPTFEEGLAVFLAHCDQEGFWIERPEVTLRPPDAEGEEHEVWFADDHVIKLAYPNFFGLRVVYRADESQACLPVEYFERWLLHNQIFGDDVEIPGAVATPDGPRLVLTQRAIQGEPASLEEIESFFLGNGWEKFSESGNIAWFDPERSLVVSDTHQGNLIRGADGALIPIDFRIQPVSGALADSVRRMSRRNGSL